MKLLADFSPKGSLKLGTEKMLRLLPLIQIDFGIICAEIAFEYFIRWIIATPEYAKVKTKCHLATTKNIKQSSKSLKKYLSGNGDIVGVE